MAYSIPCGAQPHVLNPSTPAPPPSSISEAISQLKASWHILCDFDRAQALLPIIKAGMSRRMLAKCLDVSEGTIRLHLTILEANHADQIAFRYGAISRNELIRRVRGTSKQSVAPDHAFEPESTELQPESVSNPAEVCREILHWLKSDQDRAPSAYLILRLAVGELKLAAKSGALARRRGLAGISTEDLILSRRPAPDRWILPASWYAKWLVTWVFQLIPDSKLCHNALDMALNRVRTCMGKPNVW